MELFFKGSQKLKTSHNLQRCLNTDTEKELSLVSSKCIFKANFIRVYPLYNGRSSYVNLIIIIKNTEKEPFIN